VNLTIAQTGINHERRLVQSESDPAFAQNHPEIAAYAQAYENANIFETQIFGFDEDALLRENPDLLNAYIRDRSGVEESVAGRASEFGDFSGEDAAYAGDRALGREAVKAGIHINSERIAADEVQVTASRAGPQAPQI